MIAAAPAATGVPVDLPRWYAVARRDGLRPFEVFNEASGAAVHRFETDGQPGAVLFDGYLFDQSELEAQLALPPSTPAAVVYAAFNRWGRDLFDHVDGCYLSAVWDGATRRLLVGHDALGRHPVYYANEADGFWFGSNILALAHSGHVSPDLNRVSLALGLLAYWPEAGETSFTRVRRLRPGHVIEWHDGRVSQHRYWEPVPGDDEPWMRDEEAREAFEPMLMRSVSRCMALSPQGIMLSGGVDSVTVAALAATWWRTNRTPPLVAVSGQTGYALSPEEATQSKVAQALGMRHLVSTTREWREGRNGIELSLEAVKDLPSPSRVYWVGTYMRFYQRAARQDLRVLLTGAGGDTWLGVADTHAADLLRGLRLAQLARFMKSDLATGGATVGDSARRLLWQSGLRPHVDSLWAAIAPRAKARYHKRKWDEHLPAWFCPDPRLREAVIDRLLGRRTPPLTDRGTRPRSYYRHALRSLSNPYMHYENEVAFHVERTCGLCLLSPYHDRRLVDFFGRISPRALVHGDRYKGLLRPVVARHLPNLGLERQRKDGEKEHVQRLAHLREGIAAAWPAFRFSRLESLGLLDARGGMRQFECGEKGNDELARMHILMSSERWVDTHAGTGSGDAA